jgi:hypothetical protein
LVNIEFSLIGKNSDSVSLAGPDYILETGATGFGIPQPLVRIDGSAGNGGQFRYLKRGIRVVDLPITVISDSGINVEPKLRRLARIMADEFTLQANYDNGQTWFIKLYLDGGAETTFGDTGNNFFAKWVLSARAPQPFWTSTQASTFSVSANTEERGLLGIDDGQRSLSELQLISGQALGQVSVNNSGDVDSPIQWRIDGPATEVSISLNGLGFTYETPLEATDSILINTELGTVLTATGDNAYAGLGTAPKFFSLPTGGSLINIVATGADETTKISGSYNPRREVLH